MMRERPKSSSNTIACAFIASIPRAEPSRNSLLPKSSTLGRPFLNKVNGGRFSIHQQEAAPFEIFHYVIAPSRSKLALVLRHQTVQAVQFFADFLPRGVLGVTTWHLVNPLIVQTAARLGQLFLDDEG